MNRYLCLDGPLNGLYATYDEVREHGYWLSLWADTQEEVWEHGPPGLTQGVPLEFVDAELARLHT